MKKKTTKHKTIGGTIYYLYGPEKIFYNPNGPAIKYADGDDFWFNKNSELHREDGPAIENKKRKTYYWYLNGVEYSKKEYYRELVKRGIITKEEAFCEVL